jgi:hypothetical protein
LSASISSRSSQRESSFHGLVSCFLLAHRKQTRRSRVTSVVFNPHGSEILASYSAESIYLLDPKQSVSHEHIRQRLVEHRTHKQRSTHNDPCLSNDEQNQSEATPQIKRLRLGGDWSDTGSLIITIRLC